MKWKSYPKHKPSGIEPLECEGIEKDLVFQPIKKHRGTYFAQYVPARGGDYFASLALVFLGHVESSQIAKLMEQECSVWIQRYRVPLMVIAFDEANSLIHLKEDRECDHLIGIMENGKTVHYWKMLKNEEFPSGPLQEEQLLSIYAGIPFSTAEERHKQAIAHARSIRLGLFIIAVWGIAVPVFVALVGFASPLLGFIIIAYSISKAILCALKMLGYTSKSKSEKKRDEKELRMRHHHYHCERNPEGFMRLKVENLEREAKESTRRESVAIKEGQAVGPKGSK